MYYLLNDLLPPALGAVMEDSYLSDNVTVTIWFKVDEVLHNLHHDHATIYLILEEADCEDEIFQKYLKTVWFSYANDTQVKAWVEGADISMPIKTNL
jgi:hypothetical protein